MSTKLTIIYDNQNLFDGLATGWGFACLIEKGSHRVLFDTGWDGDQVLENARRLSLELRTITAIVISHEHWDHLGGLARILREVDHPTVYLPASLSRHLQQEIASRATVVAVSSPQEVGPGIFSTGELGGGETVNEQSLVLDIPGGVALLTGCAHPGLANLIQRAAARGPLCEVIGGLHRFAEIEQLAPLKRIVPCHCTVQKEAILDTFPATAQSGGVGLVLNWR